MTDPMIVGWPHSKSGTSPSPDTTSPMAEVARPALDHAGLPPGPGGRVVREGTAARDGALPVNLSGGLRSPGHPIGATGLSQHVRVAMQPMGEAGAMQLPGAAPGGVIDMGGAALANSCSILERAR